MKKKVLGLALVAMSMVSFGAAAQSPQSNGNTVCTEQAQCLKGVKGQKDFKGKKAPKCDLFSNMNLTEAQKTQLQQLQSRREADRKARMEARKNERAEKKMLDRAKKMADDSVRFAQRRADKLEYLREVKEIVGPDNYVVFLENMVVDGPQMHQNGMRPGKDKAFRMDKRKDNRNPQAFNRHDGRKAGKKVNTAAKIAE